VPALWKPITARQGSRSSSYWVTITKELAFRFPTLMDYLFRAGPIMVIFVTATSTALLLGSLVLLYVIWPTWREGLSRRKAVGAWDDPQRTAGGGRAHG